jgi:hypothetical protein
MRSLKSTGAFCSRAWSRRWMARRQERGSSDGFGDFLLEECGMLSF